MKTINYTGSSKLISRIVNLLNRRAPLPLDGDGDPDWGTNGQVLSTDGNGSTAWVNQGGGGSGGHTIVDPSGTSMPQRASLAFVDAHLTDDSVGDETEVEIAKEVTEAAFDALNPQGTEYDGLYLFEDADAAPLTADMVGYGNGTVKGALDNLIKTATETFTSTQYYWIEFPASRIVLDAHIASTLKSFLVCYSEADGFYIARWYVDNDSANFSYQRVNENTQYSIVYQYIEK